VPPSAEELAIYRELRDGPAAAGTERPGSERPGTERPGSERDAAAETAVGAGERADRVPAGPA
jgi:hypothetical protein